MFKNLLTVLLKELLTFFRSPGLVLLVLYSFTLDIYIVGGSFDVKPKNVAIGYVDYSSGVISKKILSSFHPPEFTRIIPFRSERELQRAVESKRIAAGLVFDPDFERNYFKFGKTTLNLLLDGTNAGQSYLIYSYISQIVLRFNNLKGKVELKTRKLFNPNGETSWFLTLSELATDLTLIGIVLSASFFVTEREGGTWELMLLQPVDSRIIILGKVLAQMVVSLAGVLLALGFIVFGIFDILLRGSIFLFLFATFLFTFTVSGIGLFIAAVTETMLGVALLTLFILLPILYLSGNWTPLNASPKWVQMLSYLSPLRYYFEIVLGIFFKGLEFKELLFQFFALFSTGLVLFLFGYRRIGRLF